MRTKIIFTPDYILLQEVLFESSDINDAGAWKNLAYFKLNKSVPNLINLPLLPDWDEEVNIELLSKNEIQVPLDILEDKHLYQRDGFIKGFQKSQELSKDKKFTLEDIHKAIEMAREQTGWSDNTMEDCYDEDEIINNLIKNKLPKEFIPEFNYYYEKYKNTWYPTCKSNYDMVKRDWGDKVVKIELKTIDTSKGKEIVGKWIF